MKKSQKVLLSILVLCLLVFAGIALSGNEYLQGRMQIFLNVKPVRDVTGNVSNKLDVNNIDITNMKYIKQEFAKYKKTMPAQVISFPQDNPPQNIILYKNLMNNMPAMDPEKLKERIYDHSRLQGANPGTGEPEQVPQDSSFIGKIKEYVATLSWDSTNGGQPKENYLFAFPLGNKVTEVYPSSININNPSTWQMASVFAICVIGNESATIHSPLLKGQGAPSMKQKYKVSMSKYNESTGEYEIISMWDNSLGQNKPIETDADWNIQFTGADVIKLDPNGENVCTAISAQYMEVKKQPWENNNPAWSQIRLKGLISNLPVYHVVDQTYLNRLGGEDSWEMNGTINVFEKKSEISVYKNNNGYIHTNTYKVNDQHAWLADFELKAFPHNTALVKGVNLNLITEGYEELEMDIMINVNEYESPDFHNNPKNKYYNFEATVKGGSNYIEFPNEVLMQNGKSLNMGIEAKILPPTPGSMQFVLTGVNTNAISYQGKCWKYLYEYCSEPLDEVPSNINNIIEEVLIDPVLILNFEPKNQYNWITQWFSALDIKTDQYGNMSPQLFWLYINRAPEAENAPDIRIDPIKIEVLGSFNTGMGIKSRVSGSTPEYPEKIKEHMVAPGPGTGSKIILDEIYLPKYYNSNISLHPFALPSDAGVTPKNVRFKVDEIKAYYVQDGINVKAGDPVPISWSTDPNFAQFPITSKHWFMGMDLLHVSPSGGSNLPQYIFLDDIQNGADYDFSLNDALLMAQGDLKLYGHSDFFENTGNNYTYTVKYQHAYSPHAPKNDIILRVGDEEIYFNDAVAGTGFAVSKWTEEYLEFTLTNMKPINHGSIINLSLRMEIPTEPMNNVWFKLVDVKVTRRDNVEVGSYTEVFPQMKTLQSNFVNGPTYYFMCDDFNYNGTCDKNE